MKEVAHTEQNLYASYAAKFINGTNKHVFLTGKAGTGKTTFLRYIVKHTYKNSVIVAPTGIAAINAGGVTIHSLFQLPFGTFVPNKEAGIQFSENQRVNTPLTLLQNLQMHSNKRRLLREIELLIIDEVSMLRADLLDAIDTVLRSVRRNNFPFGGVQVLFIGDLLQLPPVVKDEEWNFMRNYYKSAYFFEAQALQNNKPLYIELNKIYRQADDLFINLLNNLRNNTVTPHDIEILNKYYEPDFKQSQHDNYIYLTTHNNRADSLNKQSLIELKEKSHYFKADVSGEFPDYMYPVEHNLELKKGAQIMFVKNGPSGQQRFFNGKIGVVTIIDDKDITVEFDGGLSSLIIEPYKWENIKYNHNQVTNVIEEKVNGSFTQYPIKLAWAITVHKSQGLTFTKAIIDIGSAFAPGQVYVALSRLTSLDGLKLTSRLNLSSLSNDEKITEYATNKVDADGLETIFSAESVAYLRNFLLQCFNFNELNNKLLYHIQSYTKQENKSVKQKYFNWAVQLHKDFELCKQTADKFLVQINNIFIVNNANYLEKLLERVEKAKSYFQPMLKGFSTSVITQVNIIKEDKKVKAYTEELIELDVAFYKQQSAISKAEVLLQTTINKTVYSKENSTLEAENTERKQEAQTIAKQPKIYNRGEINDDGKRTKKVKHDTKKESYDQYKAGKTIAQIAIDRNLVDDTICGHLAYFVGLGLLNIEDFVEKKKMMDIITVIKEKDTIISGEIKSALGENYNYGEIKFVLEYYKNMKK